MTPSLGTSYAVGVVIKSKKKKKKKKKKIKEEIAELKYHGFISLDESMNLGISNISESKTIRYYMLPSEKTNTICQRD